MAKDDKVDENPVDEVVETPVETPEVPEVELDKPTDVQGDLVENPTIEEEVDEPEPTPDEGAETVADEGEPEPPVQPAPEVPEKDETGVYSPPPADPGEFQPTGDYSFEVKLADGQTVKISTPAEAEALADRIDNEDNLMNAKQFLQFSRSVVRMDNGLEREQADFQAKKEAFEQTQAQQQVRDERLTQWNNEINYMRAKGMLPEITPELNRADWTDPKNAEQEPVKATVDIFKWMEKENAIRLKSGIPEITSAYDAYNLMKAENQETSIKEEKTKESDTRRAKGKMVSGNAPYTPENTQPNSIVGEGGSLKDLVAEASMNM